MDKRKKVISGVFFIGIMGLTFYALFYGKDPAQIWSAVKKMQPLCLAAAMALALSFVALEGMMIWYLLTRIERETDTAGKKRKLTGRKEFANTVGNERIVNGAFPWKNLSWKGLRQCISYSFTGFFYSGLTPSASGGQPMQLYHMCKDQHKASDASVVLMTVAVMYKFVLVVIGSVLLLFWRQLLQRYLGGYFLLYILGMLLNLLLVVLLILVMLRPVVIQKAGRGLLRGLVAVRLLKNPTAWEAKLSGFVDSYQTAVDFLRKYPGHLWIIGIVTFLQRSTLFVLTYMVYLGLGQQGTGALTVILLQAAVYITVDMLPLPGSQGISELVYTTAFSQIFSADTLLPSTLISRGINFYFLMLVSLVTALRQGRCHRRGC